MKKVLRMSSVSYLTEKEFKKNLDAIKRNIDVVDEATLFVDTWHHGYVPFDMQQRFLDVIDDRIARIKEAGVKSVGINVLCTIGHTEDGAGLMPKADMQYMMDIEGNESGSCLCYSDKRFNDYIEKRYSLFAKTDADFLWIDDDVRIPNHGVVKECCFCPECLRVFNERNNTDYSIEYIRENFHKNEELKSLWLKTSNDTLISLMTRIRKVIKQTNPHMEIGFMDTHLNSSYDLIRESGATMLRPGGGFYSDRNLKEMFKKGFSIQKTVKKYPESIKDIQYEYESYNFRTYEKSVAISETETSYISFLGCNGSMYNRWDWDIADKFYDMMRKSASKWDTLTDINNGCKNAGVFCANNVYASRLNELGIPVTAYFENAVSSFIIGNDWNEFDDDGVNEILSKNVYTDGRGLEILNERGFEKYTGMTVKKTYPCAVVERFLNHPFNGKYDDSYRHISMDIFHDTDAYAICADKKAEALSYIETIVDDRDDSFFIYESEYGTKIAVDGCLMSNQMNLISKRHQIVNVLEWLSGNKLQVMFDENIQLVPTITVDGKGGMNIMLINSSLDETGDFELIVRDDKEYKLIGDNGERLPVEQTSKDNERILKLKNIKGWGYVVVTNK